MKLNTYPAVYGQCRTKDAVLILCLYMHIREGFGPTLVDLNK